MVHRVRSRRLVEGVMESPLGRITLSGYIRDNVGVLRERPRVLGAYATVYVLDGGGFYTDARGMARTIAAGDLIVLFPDLAHSYGPANGQHWDELYIVFDGPVFDLLRKRGVYSPERPVMQLEPLEYWRAKFEQVVVDTAGSVSPLTAIGRLVQVLSEAADSVLRGQIGNPEHAWLVEARRVLDRAAGDRRLSLEEVARELDMSYVAFRKRFVVLMGVAPGRYRVRRTIDRACQLMHTDPQLGNKQLARMCGFANEYHFSRRFKQIMGMTPRQFRSQAAIAAVK